MVLSSQLRSKELISRARIRMTNLKAWLIKRESWIPSIILSLLKRSKLYTWFSRVYRFMMIQFSKAHNTVLGMSDVASLVQILSSSHWSVVMELRTVLNNRVWIRASVVTKSTPWPRKSSKKIDAGCRALCHSNRSKIQGKGMWFTCFQ